MVKQQSLEARKCPKISKYLQNNYTTLISTKNATTFVLTTLPYGHFIFLIAILISIKINKNAIKPYFLHRSAISTVSAFLLKICAHFFQQERANSGEVRRTRSTALIDYPDHGERR